jgi:hypothetical protein
MIVNASAQARAILTMKSVNVEPAREMGRAQRGAWTPERSRKMREAFHAVMALDAEVRRYLRAERRSKWLTDCIVEHSDSKRFDLEGIDPDRGKRFAVHLVLPLDVELLGFLTAVMNCPDAPMRMRLDAAKTLAPLVHEKPSARVVVEHDEQWHERQRERHRENARRSYWRLRGH